MVVNNVFVMIYDDHCIYTKMSKSKFVFMTLYVDDILIVENDMDYVNEVKTCLSSQLR